MEKIAEIIEWPLVCPIDKSQLLDKKDFYECIKCGAKYKVNNGIPNLIPEEAEPSEKN